MCGGVSVSEERSWKISHCMSTSLSTFLSTFLSTSQSGCHNTAPLRRALSWHRLVLGTGQTTKISVVLIHLMHITFVLT